MNEVWKKWCRLCGCNKIKDFDVKIHFVSINETVYTAALKYFGILISKNDDNSKVCHMCDNAVKSIIKYNDHVLKVNEMFIDLEKNYTNKNVDISFLKEKYGLFNEDNLLHNHIINGITNISTSETKNNVQIKSEFSISPKVNKTEECYNEISGVNDCFEQVKERFNQNAWNNIEVESEKPLENRVLGVNDSTGKKENLKCEICCKVFQSTKGRTIHMKKQHSIKKGPPFTCNTCGRIFKRFQQLNIHESIHLSEKERKFYFCPKCNKKFVSEWYVQDHIRIVHDGDRRFICELCGAAFGTNKNLLDHHLTHSEEKKFHCSKCNKAFKCKRTLKFHVETHDETEYPCHLCGLKLNTKRILRRHMLVHSDENKYKCNFCSKEFKRQYEFKNHLLLHTGLKLYQCSFCELTFSNGSNCRKHQRAIHSIELANAESKGTLILVENVPSFKQLMAANEEALIRNKS
ncbi:zinc finger protein 254-like [Condylostylus longicornis]|uniref:zinc finger protein 254-like n=1 Tax=Condylostylus longicornis TaxID=2530218 RepID=UPI00244E1DAA|nr:zinc finger protein 254-like [Condylostylus longicornis]